MKNFTSLGSVAFNHYPDDWARIKSSVHYMTSFTRRGIYCSASSPPSCSSFSAKKQQITMQLSCVKGSMEQNLSGVSFPKRCALLAFLPPSMTSTRHDSTYIISRLSPNKTVFVSRRARILQLFVLPTILGWHVFKNNFKVRIHFAIGEIWDQHLSANTANSCFLRDSPGSR